MTGEIRIGVSSCLLGERVRYDGWDKRDRYITDVLGRSFTLIPVCPEVGCGLPVPREVMRLEGDPAHPRLVTIESRIDHTERMLGWCGCKMAELAGEELSGFILKSRSPSCGLSGVEVFSEGGTGSGRGLFAAAVTEYFPLLPVEEEGRLSDPALRESFIERVFAWRRRQDSREGDGVPAPGNHPKSDRPAEEETM